MFSRFVASIFTFLATLPQTVLPVSFCHSKQDKEYCQRNFGGSCRIFYDYEGGQLSVNELGCSPDAVYGGPGVLCNATVGDYRIMCFCDTKEYCNDKTDKSLADLAMKKYRAVNSGGPGGLMIALYVALPLAALAIIAIIALCIYRRNAKAQQERAITCALTSQSATAQCSQPDTEEKTQENTDGTQKTPKTKSKTKSLTKNKSKSKHHSGQKSQPNSGQAKNAKGKQPQSSSGGGAPDHTIKPYIKPGASGRLTEVGGDYLILATALRQQQAAKEKEQQNETP